MTLKYGGVIVAGAPENAGAFKVPDTAELEFIPVGVNV